MTKKKYSIQKEAIKSLEYHISFLKSLKENIRQGEPALVIKSIFAAHCLHEFMQEKLMPEVEEKMRISRKEAQ